MKKVGILTLSGNNNYGNKLQNYAIIHFLKKQGFNPSTIWVTNPIKGSKIKQIFRFFIKKYNDRIRFYKRRKYFLNFNKLLNIKNVLIFDDDINKIQKKYDYFLVGSDQVWNYNYFNNDSIYFLNNSPKEKNIAISASFGVEEIPKPYITRYKKGLKNFNHISVREERGKQIIEDITKRKDIEVLIDPTMLLSKEEWKFIEKKPKKLNSNKYILNYFLGELSDERKKEIYRVAKENDCDVINILDENDPLYESGPSEFLYLEKNAFLICTDSFHSSVFAILYDKPFVVFKREQKNSNHMFSRLETLLSTFKISNRVYNGKCITKENLEHNYSEAYKILEKERKKFKNFIKKI